MQPNPQTRQCRAATRHHVEQLHFVRHDSNTGAIPIASVPALLRHHAGFVEVILCAICAGETISIAGRRALAFTVERIHECAEVLNGH